MATNPSGDEDWVRTVHGPFRVSGIRPVRLRRVQQQHQQMMDFGLPVALSARFTGLLQILT